MVVCLACNYWTQYLIDFKELEAVLNVDLALGAFLLDELISLVEVAAEGIVGVDNSQLRILPRDSAVGVEPVPQVLRKEEVVALDLSVERGRRNVEVGVAALEVEVAPEGLVNGSPPAEVVLRDEEGMLRVYPGLFESLDAFHVVLLTHGQHEMIVLDLSTIAQLHLVFLGEELLDADSLGVGVEGVDGHLGEGSVLALGGPTFGWRSTFPARRCCA